ncbi:hypothetical protein D3C80_2015340 [compost metagenome]
MYGFDSFNHLIKRVMFTEHQLILTKPVHAASCTFKTENKTALKLFLPFPEFAFAKTLYGRLMKNLLSQLQNILGLFRGCPRIYRE